MTASSFPTQPTEDTITDITTNHSTSNTPNQAQPTMEPNYRLTVRQQPKKARLCSFKEKMDRRPLDPPPIVQLLTDERNIQYPYFFLYATLVSENGKEDLTFSKNAKTIAGTTVQSLHRLRDHDNEGCFFIFADVSIRMEGFFKLRFTLFEIIGSFAARKCSVLSDVFQVHSPKSFPGMSESTFLTRSFSEQGVRIRIRKETRSNQSPPSKRRRSDDQQETSPNTMRHQSLPAIKSTQSIMSMKNILISPIQESATYHHSATSSKDTRLLTGQTTLHPLDSDKLSTLDPKYTIIQPNPPLPSHLCYSPSSSCSIPSPSSQSYFHYRSHPHRHSS
ncbi:velvet factor-domain-containing protein [Chlamydoabsidia padenii]|nr:velvet factor-domain-containing protein [Chlamydoabsidia padenii]